MQDLPRPGIEPVFPALAGGFLTTAPPGKSLKNITMFIFFLHPVDVWKLFFMCFKHIVFS